MKPLETVAIFEGFDIFKPTQKNPVRRYNPKKVKEFFCKGEFKPGFLEQARSFVETYQNHDQEASSVAADLKSCYTVTRLCEALGSQ